MSKEKLKPCPFCGYDHMDNEPILKEDIFFFIECPRCGARGANAITYEKRAIERWNRRINNE